MTNIARISSRIAEAGFHPEPSMDDAERDVNAILQSFQLHAIRRYYGQIHWTSETEKAARADRAEPGLKLENVAAHSWHVADAALLLVGHFPSLDPGRVTMLAVLHDKLEIYTGDYDPVGRDGQGTHSHAFSAKHRIEKEKAEQVAMHSYLSALRESARHAQRALLLELIETQTDEARYVKAIDKLQALAFVLVKKEGQLTDDHLTFTIRYSRKAIDYFPKIARHYEALVRRLVIQVAERRGISSERQADLSAKLRIRR